MARNITQWLTSVGGVLALLAPKGLCPVCVAASGGLLASLGLGFLAVETNIRWILAGTLSLGLLGLVLSARRHRRRWTVPLGVVAGTAVMLGRLTLIDVVLYIGMILLMAALAADLWAKKHPRVVPLVQIRLQKGARGGAL